MRLAVGLLPLAAIIAGGCAHRGNVDLLEARLREQEDQLRSLHAQVDRMSSELTAARRLNESLKQMKVQIASHDASIELSEQQFQVTGLKINSLLTGGFNRDGQPGDDQVTLVFAPVDRREQAIQLPGRVECELLELAPSVEPKRIGFWSFDAAKTRAAWQKTLGSDGYRLELPWQTPPSSGTLELLVRFHSQHGDRFETKAPIQVSLPLATLGADRLMP